MHTGSLEHGERKKIALPPASEGSRELYRQARNGRLGATRSDVYFLGPDPTDADCENAREMIELYMGRYLCRNGAGLSANLSTREAEYITSHVGRIPEDGPQLGGQKRIHAHSGFKSFPASGATETVSLGELET